ncbi:MFS transporter [Streptomyces sp. NPDC057654]|uniref:MFS transporter n=1 Tax=Streptomyces sp. NPDC057654 TaxID=3346196 RepID=UPI0036758083
MISRERLAISGLFAVHGAVTGSLASRIPALAGGLHISPGPLGLALLMQAVGGLLTMPFAGRLVYRLGGRRGARLLVMCWCAALALPAVAPGLAALSVAFLIFGMAAGVSDVAINAQGARVEERLGKSIMSSLHGLWSLGSFLGAGIGAVMAGAQVGYRAHLLVAAAVLALLAPVLGGGLPADSTGEAAAGAPAPPRFSLPTGVVLLLGLLAFCSAFAEGSAVNWSAIYLDKVTGASDAVAAAGYTMFACTMSVMRLSGDLIVGRFGPVRTVRVGGTVSACGGALIVFADSPVMAYPGFAMLGLGIAVVVPLAFSAASRTGQNPGQAIAGVATVSYGSSLAAPAIVGGIADAVNLQTAFVLITLLVACIAVGAGLMRTAAVGRAEQPAGDLGADLDVQAGEKA